MDVALTEIDLRVEDQEEQWNSLVDDCVNGQSFFRKPWILGLQEDLAQSCFPVGIWKGTDLVGGILLSRFGRWRISGVRRPYATPYTGPIFRRSGREQDAILRSVVDQLQAQHHIVQITDIFQSQSHDEIVGRGATSRSKSTYLLPLDDSNQLWTNFKGELRTNIRKAAKLGIRISVAEDVAEFFDQYRELFESQRLQIPFTLDRFEAFCRRLALADAGRVYEARDAEGRLHAASLVTFGGRRAFYTLSATHSSLRLSGAASLLLWEVIKQMESHGRVLDLVGSNIPSIARFKRRFRGKYVLYNEHLHCRNWAIARAVDLIAVKQAMAKLIPQARNNSSASRLPGR